MPVSPVGGGSFLSCTSNIINISWILLPYALLFLYSINIVIYLFISLFVHSFIHSFVISFMHSFIYYFFITFCDLWLRQSATFPVPEPAQPLRVVSREGDCWEAESDRPAHTGYSIPVAFRNYLLRIRILGFLYGKIVNFFSTKLPESATIIAHAS